MHAVVVTLITLEQVDVLFPRLQQAFGQVALYQRGRRSAGGPIHFGEGLLRRLYPEYLLQSFVLLLMVPGALMLDVVDGVLGILARLDDPTGARVKVLDLRNQQARTMVGSAGE